MLYMPDFFLLSSNTLQSLLGNPKDKFDKKEKSGIYEIGCKNCDKNNVGQTCCFVRTRFKEHLTHLKNDMESLAFSQHISLSDHRIDLHNLKFLRHVKNMQCVV